jgi:hypothetical protein
VTRPPQLSDDSVPSVRVLTPAFTAWHAARTCL